MSIFDNLKNFLTNIADIIKQNGHINNGNKTALDVKSNITYSIKNTIDQNKLPQQKPIIIKPNILNDKHKEKDFRSGDIQNKSISESDKNIFAKRKESYVDNLNIQPENFTSIYIDCEINLELNISSGFSNNISVIGDSKLSQSLILEKNSPILSIKNKTITPSSSKLIINISMLNLNDLHINSRADCKITGLNSDNFSIFIRGTSDLSVSGTAKLFNLNLNGIAKINAKDLICDRALIHIPGKANVILTVKDELDARVPGIGTIDLYGNPEKIYKRIDGQGRINNCSIPSQSKEFNSPKINIKRIEQKTIIEPSKYEQVKDKNLTQLALFNQFKNDNSIIDLLPENIPIPIYSQSEESEDEDGFTLDDSEVSSNIYSFEEYKLGTENKERLNLSNKDENYLNWVSFYSTVFTDIEQCCDQTIRLYLFLLKTIKKYLISKNTSLENKISALVKKSKKDFYYEDKSHWQSTIATNIFKISENIIRNNYGHKRKLDISYHIESLQSNIDKGLEKFIFEKIEIYSPYIELPTIQTQIELNTINKTLWKDQFKNIENNIDKVDLGPTILALDNLYKVNIYNSNLPTIYFSASKLLAKLDKKSSLKAYINYFYLNLQEKGKLKNLPVTSKKAIFKNETEYTNFTKTLDLLEKNNELEVALSKLDDLLSPPRKKIILDTSAINEIKELDSDTLEKLNEVLKEDEVVETESIVVNTLASEELKSTFQDIFSRSDSVQSETINFNNVQREFLKILSTNSSLTDNEVSEFAKSNNIFKSQLINGINELSFEAFDDNLIEETVDSYRINSEYKDKIRI